MSPAKNFVVSHSHTMVVPLEPSVAPSGKVPIEAVSTITPAYPTGFREPRRITWDDNDEHNGEAACIPEEALQSRTQLVLFYRDPTLEDETAGWTLAQQLNESLSVALMEHAVLAGKIRRTDGGGGLEIKYTDSGIRLVQAKAEGVTISELMCPDNNARDDKGLEDQLLYWADVDEHAIEYSPLFYVQLTIFPREGYAIGISSSLLLTDPLQVSTFLRTWSQTHSTMLRGRKFHGAPGFHLSNFGRRGGRKYLDSPPLRQGPKNKAGVFVVAADAAGADHAGADQEPETADFGLLVSCCPEASMELEPLNNGRLESPETVSPLVFANDVSGHLKLRYSGTGGSFARHGNGARSQLKVSAVNWEEFLGINFVKFQEQAAPLYSSFRLETVASRGTIVTIPSDNHRTATVICATLPIAASTNFAR